MNPGIRIKAVNLFVESVYQAFDFMQIVAAHDFLRLGAQFVQMAVVDNMFDFENSVCLYAEIFQPHAQEQARVARVACHFATH